MLLYLQVCAEFLQPLPLQLLSLDEHSRDHSKAIFSKIPCPLSTPTLQCQDKQIKTYI